MRSEWFDIRAARGRRLLYVSDACIVFAGVVFAVDVGKHWAWGPFVVGLAVAAGGIGGYALVLRIAKAALRPSAEDLQRMRSGLRQRATVAVVGYACIGVCCGLIAGGTASYWPDVVLAAMIVVMGIGVPLALLPWAKRKAAAAR